MRHANMRVRKSRRGQAMAELALSLPFLLLVLFIIFEVTFAISTAANLDDAVHYAARVQAESHGSFDDVEDRVREYLRSDRLIDQKLLKVVVDEGTDFNGKRYVTVSARLPLRPVTFSNMSEFTLRARAVYRMELDRPEA